MDGNGRVPAINPFAILAGRRTPPAGGAQPAWFEQRPPPEVRGGAHPDLLAPGTVTFVLHAPHKPYVSLVGDFNDWDTRRHPLATDNTGFWWTTIPHPGRTRYGYYVAVDADAHVWVGDPYAALVEWSSDDNVWARLSAQQAPFAWSDPQWRTPPLRDLVIYELCVRDFVGKWGRDRPRYGTFRDLLGKVDYLADLGVNAVELMPVQAFPGESSWGYNPVFYFAPARSYGTADDLKRFVDACHGAGIAVLLDVAYNHAWGQHPWYHMYPAMYGRRGEWLTNLNPFFHHTPQSVNSWGGLDWDHFARDTTAYFQDVTRYWLTEYHLDGFRFDWVCGIEYDHRDPLNPGFNPYHGISALAWAARQVKPDCILIGEYWMLDGMHPHKSASKLVAESGLDAVWNGEFHHTLDEALNHRWEWEKKDLRRAIGGYRDLGYRHATEVIHYTTSHDEVRPEHAIRYYSAKHIPRPQGMTLDQLVLMRAQLGLVALFAGAGVPMLYSGQEFGDSGPRTIDFLPLQWGLLNKPAHQAHHELVKRLIRARRQHAALRSDWIEFEPFDFERTGVQRFWRWDGQGDAAAVVLNWTPRARRVSLHVPFGGRWHDVVADRTRAITAGPLHVSLPPYGAALFVPAAPER